MSGNNVLLPVLAHRKLFDVILLIHFKSWMENSPTVYIIGSPTFGLRNSLYYYIYLEPQKPFVSVGCIYMWKSHMDLPSHKGPGLCTIMPKGVGTSKISWITRISGGHCKGCGMGYQTIIMVSESPMTISHQISQYRWKVRSQSMARWIAQYVGPIP